MAANYLPYEPEQMLLLPEALVRISANVTDGFGNVTGLSGRC